MGRRENKFHSMVTYLDFDHCLSFNTKTSKFQKWVQVLSLRVERIWTDLFYVLCFVDPAALYNLVNKANLVLNLFLAYLFLVYLSGCTLHTRQSSTQNNKYQVSHKHSCFSWWWAHSGPKHVEIDKYTKNKYLRINCAPSWLYLQDKQIYLQLGT